MELEELKNVIVDVLNTIQEESGRELVEISNDSCPIGDLPGFDSLNGLEATLLLSDRLGVEIETDSLLVNEEGNKAISINDIAVRVQSLLDI